MSQENKIMKYKSTIDLRSVGEPVFDLDFIPDSREGIVYVYDEDLELAVEVALATGRPRKTEFKAKWVVQDLRSRFVTAAW